MKEDQGDHFVKYLADTAALYMNSRTENANVLNDAPELSADMEAVKRLTATNLDQETLQRALRLYGNEAAEFNLEYGQKLQAVKETVLTPEFKELMKANNITDEGVMYENLGFQSAYESEIEECTFGEFKQCFTGIHIMPNK